MHLQKTKFEDITSAAQTDTAATGNDNLRF